MKKTPEAKQADIVRSELFKTSIKNSLHSAFGEVWDEVIAQLKGDVYAEIDGYAQCELRVVDGCAGEEWCSSKLSDLVTEYISDRDGTCCSTVESDWCDAIAADMEKQAKRLRKHAAQLRSPI
jgi:hypothetical protein